MLSIIVFRNLKMQRTNKLEKPTVPTRKKPRYAMYDALEVKPKQASHSVKLNKNNAESY